MQANLKIILLLGIVEFILLTLLVLWFFQWERSGEVPEPVPSSVSGN